MTTIRWISRSLGVLLVGLFLLFLGGQGFNPLRLNGTEIALFSGVLVALSGMLLVWRQELLGGVLVIAGMTAFYVTNFVASGQWPGGWVFPLCFLPGILALVCWWATRANRLASQR